MAQILAASPPTSCINEGRPDLFVQGCYAWKYTPVHLLRYVFIKASNQNGKKGSLWS